MNAVCPPLVVDRIHKDSLSFACVFVCKDEQQQGLPVWCFQRRACEKSLKRCSCVSVRVRALLACFLT